MLENNKFKGVFTALVTPFLDNYSNGIDEEALIALINRQALENIHGLVLAGSTGESATLSLDERILLVKTAKKIAKGQVIIAGAGSNCTKTAIKMQNKLEEAGADATLQVAPYYNKPTTEGLLQHFSLIAKNAQKPIILYNIPSRTGIDMSLEVLLKLLEEEKIIGIKESNPKVERLQELIIKARKVRPNATILTGEDGLFLPSLSLGADGIISVAANLLITELLQIYFYIKSNDLLSAQKISNNTYEISKLLFTHTNPIPIKTILYKLGLIKNAFRLPLCPLTIEEENSLWEQYEKAKNSLNG